MNSIIWAHRQPRHLLFARLEQGHGLRYQSENIARADRLAIATANPSCYLRLSKGRGWAKGTWILRHEAVS